MVKTRKVSGRKSRSMKKRSMKRHGRKGTRKMRGGDFLSKEKIPLSSDAKKYAYQIAKDIETAEYRNKGKDIVKITLKEKKDVLIQEIIDKIKNDLTGLGWGSKVKKYVTQMAANTKSLKMKYKTIQVLESLKNTGSAEIEIDDVEYLENMREFLRGL